MDWLESREAWDGRYSGMLFWLTVDVSCWSSVILMLTLIVVMCELAKKGRTAERWMVVWFSSSTLSTLPFRLPISTSKTSLHLIPSGLSKLPTILHHDRGTYPSIDLFRTSSCTRCIRFDDCVCSCCGSRSLRPSSDFRILRLASPGLPTHKKRQSTS